MMRLARRALAGVASLFLLAPPPASAGAPETSLQSSAGETTAAWNGELATGWDSLYMFRGVNQLPGYEGYGSSLSWTGATVTINLGPADSLALGTWAAFGLGESDYKEIDATATYTRTVGDWAFSFGYALYAVLNQTNGLYAHELNVAIAYSWQCGPVTLTPALGYAFNLGPAPGNRGYVEQASSYLEARLDAEIPLLTDRLALAPWIALGTNFRYNLTARSDPPAPFIGSDHAEFGVALPVRLAPAITLNPYAAASAQWTGLAGTRPLTFWAGAAVTFAF